VEKKPEKHTKRGKFDSLGRVYIQEPAIAGKPWGGTRVWTLSQIPYKNSILQPLTAGLLITEVTILLLWTDKG
jgi:hypothetical protein